MAIRPITPSFRGLLVTPDKKTAFNTKYIMTMKEYEDSVTNEPSTAIFMRDGKYLNVEAPLDKITTAYIRSSYKDDAVVEIKK